MSAFVWQVGHAREFDRCSVFQSMCVNYLVRILSLHTILHPMLHTMLCIFSIICIRCCIGCYSRKITLFSVQVLVWGHDCNLHLAHKLLVLTSHKRSIFKGDTRTLLGIVSERFFTVNHVYRICLLLDTRVLVLQIRANYRDRSDCIQ